MQQHGFILEREERVVELSGLARLWRHTATGAKVLSFASPDENKVFGVSFRTPPHDSTGVAHILEHSVLCGSEKYPIKEPFVELLKGSLQTFLNAFTYPDKTCYPVASANLQDFRNLVDVYLDAVFFPRISRAIFQQEGWHLEPDGSGALIFKGVVYNEMKGAFSAPESVLGRHCLHALFPDTVYALESGGDPDDIPSLSYEAFCDFHKRYYHPSNARFFFWGDDPEEERLERLGAVLARFSREEVDSRVSLQPRLAGPRAVHVPFAASEGENGMVVVNWLGPDVMDVEANLAFRMLEHILFGMPPSPLRRALIESGLGEDLAGQGLETELRQLTFDAGLKGVALHEDGRAGEAVVKARAGLVEELIFSTLRALVEEGIDADILEAAVNSVEFALRENNTGRFPVGLSVMLRSLTTWLHDGDPLAPLRFEAPLKAIKDKLASGTRGPNGYFESLIKEWLLENPHRVTVILTPDPGLAERREAKEEARLAFMAEGMDEAGRKNLEEDLEALRFFQETPDSAQDLAKIPRLGAADLPLENAVIPSESPAPYCRYHSLPTAGIVYADAALDLGAVPEALLPLLPMFGRGLLEMGTKERDFVDLNMTIARKTGGMDIDSLFLTHAQTRQPVARLMLSGKAAPDKAGELFSLMGEVLTEPVLGNEEQRERFLRMVLEEKARQEHSLVPAGHMIVACRLRAALSGAGMLAERTGGIAYLYFLRGLAARVESDWPGVAADLEALRRLVIRRSGLAVNLTATAGQRAELLDLAAAFAARLPEGPGLEHAGAFGAWSAPAGEALLLPAQVNYVGKGINLFDAGYAWHGSASVIIKHLRTGYLWEKVRVQGGAYGCICSLDRMSGAFVMVSYRDPNILPTLNVYDGAARHLMDQSIGKEQLEAAIVGAIGELDSYLLPDAKGAASFTRELCGDTGELRGRLREEILGTTPEHFYRFGEALAAFAAKGRVCALGGGALERAAEDRGWHVEKVL